MKVIELSAGLGWYTAILGPLLTPEGQLTVTSSDPNGPPESEPTINAKYLRQRLSNDRTSYSRVSLMVVDWKSPSVTLGPGGSADAVLTFRNLHGWIRQGTLDRVLSACFAVLKSGGTLGVVEHRAKADASSDPEVIADTGYVPEAYVIHQVEKVGFELVGRSEVNANAKDTKDYPKGVWTLPPTLRLREVDRDKYLAIGESDRMTLRFRKP
jgi:predicted methyltransferase